MNRPSTPRLTAGEIEIMQMLWATGQVTLSEAQQAMSRPVGYTTVQTRLNRLVEKGLVVRSQDRPAKYSAAVTPDEVSAGHLELLLKRVSGGSVVPLVANLIRDRRLTQDEIHELQDLIDQATSRLAASPQQEEKP